jgi:hypothetical protein
MNCIRQRRQRVRLDSERSRPVRQPASARDQQKWDVTKFGACTHQHQKRIFCTAMHSCGIYE